MTDPKARDHASPVPGLIYRERPRDGNPFDQPDRSSGQEYDIEHERALGRALPAGQEDRIAAGGDPATPPEEDDRASFDPETGAVRDPGLVEDGGLPSPPRP